METKFKYKEVVIVANEKSSFYNNTGTIVDYGKVEILGKQTFYYKVKFFWPLPNPLSKGTYTSFYLFYEDELDSLPPGEDHWDDLPESPYPPVPVPITE